MDTKIISDHSGNQKRISDKPDSTNLVINLSVNRKEINKEVNSDINKRRISNIPDSTNLVINVPVNRKEINKEMKYSNLYDVPKNLDSEHLVDSDVVHSSDSNNRILHNCIKGLTTCKEKEDGSMWLYIGTYKSRINFCPHCGYKVKNSKNKSN